MDTVIKLSEQGWRELAKSARGIRRRFARLNNFCVACGLPKRVTGPFFDIDRLLLSFFSDSENLMHKQGLDATKVFIGDSNKEIKLPDTKDEYRLTEHFYRPRRKRTKILFEEWSAISRESKVLRAELHKLIRTWQELNLPTKKYIPLLLKTLDKLETFRDRADNRMYEQQLPKIYDVFESPKTRDFNVFYGVDPSIETIREDDSYSTTLLGNPKIDLNKSARRYHKDSYNNPGHINNWEPEQQNKLIQWINDNLYHSQKFCKHSSYRLKHLFEQSEGGFYISNGAFKAAMVHSGYDVKNISEDNWHFNVSLKSPAIRKALITHNWKA